jgi:hypothetical protein
MPRARGVQTGLAVVGAGAVFLLAALLAFGLFGPALAFARPAGEDLANPAIRDSALRVVIVWCFVWPLAFVRASNPYRRADENRLRVLWALGAALATLHVAVAFHTGHGWSHRAAWEHIRNVGGYGDGVFVNYLFIVVWVLDALWAAVALGSYLGRPRWLNAAVHGFLAFVVVNAAVVFARWEMRVLFALLFGLSLWVNWFDLRPTAGRGESVDPGRRV